MQVSLFSLVLAGTILAKRKKTSEERGVTERWMERKWEELTSTAEEWWVGGKRGGWGGDEEQWWGWMERERGGEGRQQLLTAEPFIDKVAALQLDTSSSPHHAPTHTSWLLLLRSVTHGASQAVAPLMTHTHPYTHTHTFHWVACFCCAATSSRTLLVSLFSLVCLWEWRLSWGRKLKGTPVTDERTRFSSFDSSLQNKKAAVGSVESEETTAERYRGRRVWRHTPEWCAEQKDA